MFLSLASYRNAVHLRCGLTTLLPETSPSQYARVAPVYGAFTVDLTRAI
jgi:hypothetical protein